ncbi:MAG: 3-dehydroquinate synthase [Phycisphaerales bacterium]|nr:3-dehydroquinate synthase [Phycisphaerales bacterium]
MASPPSQALALDRDLAHAEFDGSFSVEWLHQLRFTREAMADDNSVLEQLLPDSDDQLRILAVVDSGLAENRPELPDSITSWCKRHDDRVTLAAKPLIITGGEQAKNGWDSYETTAQAIASAGICRRSLVLIFGGGAVLDAAGFAAATAHRGVKVIRFPSTTLAQGDAGIGVKNAINAFGMKNFLGTFSPPLAVINDTQLLTSLDETHWRGGLSEAIKVAALKNPELLRLIEDEADVLRQRDEKSLDAMERVMVESARLHMDHIVAGGDAFETQHARPLDLGHWAAHRLEARSDWTLSHGDAVAIGLGIDLTYATMIGRLEAQAADRVLKCLIKVGFSLQSPWLDDADELMQGIEEFREHLGGQLTIPLISSLGTPDQVHEIDSAVMKAAIEAIRQGKTPSAG